MNLRMKVNLLNALTHQEFTISELLKKKSRMIELMSDTTSDDEELVTDKFKDKNVDLKPTKPTVPFTLASIPSSKSMGTSIVDQILLEESLRANQPITASVIKLKNCNKNLSVEG